MRSTLVQFATCAAFTATLAATTLERLSMSDMAEKSTVVVRATVSGVAGELNNGAISTHYQLAVSEVWKGSAASKMELYVPGGTANGFRQLVPGAPELAVGSEFVLFLWIGPSGRPQIIGLSQGLFNVTKDASGAVVLERAGAREAMVDAKTNRAVADETVRMKPTDLRSFVQKRKSVK